MMTAPPWLKAMENGSLGEARARAFLMERFWVLERSVDVEGADYLIQRRLTSRNFLDPDPPRIGVVQVKYIQDGGTSISLHKSYVCDARGRPFTEFFLLIFTGKEDKCRSFLLSSADILREFAERTDGERSFLSIRGSKLLAGTNYAVVSQAIALNKIEQALINADFMANRQFLSASNYIEVKPDHIDPDLTLPLSNWYGNIRSAFYEEKKKLQKVVFDIEDVLEAMRKMLQSTDPDQAFTLYEEVVANHVAGDGDLHFGASFFRDEDFATAVRHHRVRLHRLRELGIAQSYFALCEKYRSAVVEHMLENDEREGTLRIDIHYDADSLLNADIAVHIADEGVPKRDEAIRGRQVLYLPLGNVFYKAFGQSEEDRSKLLASRLYRVMDPFQKQLDSIVFGEEFLQNLE
jgi:hypothetical protein